MNSITKPGEKKENRTSPISVRLDPDTKEKIEDWADRKNITFSRALETLVRIGAENISRSNEQMTHRFGGEHNLALAFLIARVATGVEHKQKSSWIEDSDCLFQVLAAIVKVIREFIPQNYEANSIDKLFSWNEVATEVLDSLKHDDKAWWPLSDGVYNEGIIPVGQLVNQFAPLIRNSEDNSETHEKIKEVELIEELLSLIWIVGRNDKRTAQTVEKKVSEQSLNIDEYEMPELINIAGDLRTVRGLNLKIEYKVPKPASQSTYKNELLRQLIEPINLELIEELVTQTKPQKKEKSKVISLAYYREQFSAASGTQSVKKV